MFFAVSAQQALLDSVKWVHPSDVTVNGLQNGYFLVMELPEEHKKLGFIDAKTEKSYLIGKSEYFGFSKIDSIYSFFEANFKTHVIEVHFNKADSIRLFEFSNRWKGFKIGLIVNSKIVHVATLDISPLAKGRIAIAGFKNNEESNAFINVIKSAASY